MKYIYTKAFKGVNENGETDTYFQPCVTMADANGEICYEYSPNGVMQMFSNDNLIELQLNATYMGCTNPIIVPLKDEVYEELVKLLNEFNETSKNIAKKMQEEFEAIESLMMDTNKKESTAMMYVLQNLHERMSNTFLNKDSEIETSKIEIVEVEDYDEDYDEDEGYDEDEDYSNEDFIN